MHCYVFRRVMANVVNMLLNSKCSQIKLLFRSFLLCSKPQTSTSTPDVTLQIRSRQSNPSDRKRHHRNTFRWYSRILLFLFITILLPTTSDAVTFFYGASGEAAVQQINDSIAGRSANIEDEKGDLSEEELKIVWIFCRSLPKLQKEGKVPDKQISRDICKQLLEMLNPLFAKPRKARETTQRRKRFTRGDRVR